LDPGSFTDPDTRDSLEAIRRRLAAIVELERAPDFVRPLGASPAFP
jgi:hypothetical protein